MLTELLSVRAVGSALFLALLWAVEGAWPMFLGRARRTTHYARNVALGIFNAGVVALLFAAGLLVVTEAAAKSEFGVLHRFSGPPGLELLLGLALIDAWQYFWHVLNHKVRLLWRFHAVHHSDAEMDASTALRFHTGEIALSAIARMIVLPVLGVSVVQLAIYETILLPVILFHHSNIRLPGRVDRVLRAVIVTPWMHWVHHSDHQPETDSNYASVLSVWDRLFRTFRLRVNPETITLGLKGFSESEWNTTRGLLSTPITHDFRRDKGAS